MAYDLLKMCVSLFFNTLNFILGGKLPPFGSAAIVVEDEDRYLVVALPRGRVVFPGGFMNWSEDPRQAAEREGHEETGFTLQADDMISFYSLTTKSWFSMSNISFVFHGRVVSGYLRNSIEGQPRWMTEEELRKCFDPHSLKILEDYLQYRKQKQHPPAA